MSFLIGRNIYIAILIFVFILLVFKHVDIASNQENYEIHAKGNNSSLHVKQTETRVASPGTRGRRKSIQWIDTYHDGHGLRMKSNNVKMKNCEYKNCKLLGHKIVPDRDNIVYGPLDADAVIFQACHLGQIMPPVRRDNDQVFVFAERETWWYLDASKRMMDPALNTSGEQTKEDPVSMKLPDVKHPDKYVNIFRFRSVFNWTMTYRRDSDIFMPYGEILSNQDAISQKLTSHDRSEPRFRINYNRIYRKKSKDVVWLVSDCETKSKRELYVQRLKRHINVDIYGGCGNLSCPKGHYNENDKHSCMYKILSEYKFVLSFENTFHTDYVTEKLFDWFPRKIIQVVYGMVNYDVIAPPETVINAANFSSPEDLAHFLKNLGANKAEYVKYLKNKSRYYSARLEQMQQMAYCNMCEKLNNLDSNRRSYPDIGLWWQLNDTSVFQNLYLQALGIQENNKSRIFRFAFVSITIICTLMLFLTNLYVSKRRPAK